jgi:hypothetical protein
LGAMSGGLASIARLLRKTWLGAVLARIFRVFRPDPAAAAERKLDRIRKLSSRAIARREPVVSGAEKRIVINSHFAWNYGPVEYALGAALRERGHYVTMVACGGLPDYCQLQNSTQDRPPCDLCLSRVSSRLNAYSLPHVTMSAYLTREDIDYSRHVAGTTPTTALRSVMEGDVNVGNLAYINLFQYFKGPAYALTAEVEAVFRRCLASAILTTRASARIMADLKPDVFVTINGKFLHWAPFIQHCRTLGIPFVTWEDYQITPTTVVFAANEIAHEQRYLETWEMALSVPLSEDQQSQIREHFKLWSSGAVTPWAGFGADATDKAEDVRRFLRLSSDRPVISLFPNIAWDSSSVGFETAFESVFDWMAKTIEYAAKRPDLDFVIRAHPAEGRLPPEWRSTVATCEAIRIFGPPVPENVRLVEANDPVSSYTLAALSNVVMTYTSTLGLEMPLRGIRPWVAAGPYYAGKGLTVDLESPAHMYRLLDANAFPPPLTPEEVERAERLAYLIRFRGTFEFPFLAGSDQLDLKKWSDIGPGGNAVLDDLCERVVNARPMIDLRPSVSS